MTQAVILAAGESSRFWPLSENGHKSLNRILGKPVIGHTIESLKSMGIGDIIVVQGPGREIEKIIEDKQVKFAVQKEPKGMGNALSQARPFLRDRFFVLGPHHLDAPEFLEPMLSVARKSGAGITLLGKETRVPWLYGMLDMKNGLAKGIVEKPEKGKEPSKIKAVSVYLLNPEFFDYMEKVPQQHYNYEEALGLYMRKNDVPVFVTEKDTLSLRYPWDILSLSRRLMENMESRISGSARIDSSVEINGNVYVGENVRIFRNATVSGPCYIGNDCVIGNNSLVRENTSLESGAVVGMNCEVTRSVFQKGSHTHSGFFGDSVIGENCRIGAGAITANVRIDRKSVKSTVRGKRMDTGQKSLGMIMGNNTRAGISVRFMPGVLVGSNCVIGPNTLVKDNVESGTVFYTEFKNVVRRRK